MTLTLHGFGHGVSRQNRPGIVAADWLHIHWMLAVILQVGKQKFHPETLETVPLDAKQHRRGL
jgi:hypothetical protein